MEGEKESSDIVVKDEDNFEEMEGEKESSDIVVKDEDNFEEVETKRFNTVYLFPVKEERNEDLEAMDPLHIDPAEGKERNPMLLFPEPTENREQETTTADGEEWHTAAKATAEHRSQWRNSQERAKRLSKEQVEVLLQFMEEHPDFANGRLDGPESKKNMKLLWYELTRQVNDLPGSELKTTVQLKKYWSDCKSASKRNYCNAIRQRRITGNKEITMKNNDHRIINVIGRKAAVGVGGLTDPLKQQLSTNMVEEDMEEENGEDELSSFNSAAPQHTSPQPGPSTSFSPQPGPSTSFTPQYNLSPQPGPSTSFTPQYKLSAQSGPSTSASQHIHLPQPDPSTLEPVIEILNLLPKNAPHPFTVYIPNEVAVSNAISSSSSTPIGPATSVIPTTTPTTSSAPIPSHSNPPIYISPSTSARTMLRETRRRGLRSNFQRDMAEILEGTGRDMLHEQRASQQQLLETMQEIRETNQLILKKLEESVELQAATLNFWKEIYATRKSL